MPHTTLLSFISTLIVIGLAACATKPPQAEVAKPSFGAGLALSLLGAVSPQPAEIVDRAETYFASLPEVKRPQNLTTARFNFVKYFLDGYAHPHSSLTVFGAEGGNEGVKAGQDYFREHPEKADQLFASYGYHAAEVNGIWTRRFEHSGFKPSGMHHDETWWLSAFIASTTDLPKPKSPTDGIAVCVKGYLSPEGRYGHFGGYRREFFATKISPR